MMQINLNDPDLPVYSTIKDLLYGQLELAIKLIPNIHTKSNPIVPVHKTRVGFRRIRSQLRILKPLFKKRYLKYLRTESKKIGRTLGYVRDLDVLKLNLNSFYQSRYGDENFNPTIWQPAFDKNYKLARNNLLKTLKSEPFLEFIQFFNTFCNQTNLGIKNEDLWGEKGTSNLNSLVKTKLFDQFNKIQYYGELILKLPEDSTFHELRIEVKRFRYTLDFFAPLLNSNPVESLINSLAILQDDLGIINDHVTAHHIIHDSIGEKLSQTELYANLFLLEYNKNSNQEKINLQNSFKNSWDSYQATEPITLLTNSIPGKRN